MAGFKELYKKFYNERGGKERVLYDTFDVDGITENLNELTLLRDAGVRFLYHGEPDMLMKGEMDVRSYKEVCGGRLTDDCKKYIIPFNISGHFISVAVELKDDGIEYTYLDSGSKTFGEIESLAGYWGKIRDVDFEDLFKERKAAIIRDCGEDQYQGDRWLREALEQELVEEARKFTGIKWNLENFLKDLFQKDVITEKPKEFSYVQYDASSCGSMCLRAGVMNFIPKFRDPELESYGASVNKNTFSAYATSMVVKEMGIVNDDLGYLSDMLNKNRSNLRQFAAEVLVQSGNLNDKVCILGAIEKLIPECQEKKKLIDNLVGDMNQEQIVQVLTSLAFDTDMKLDVNSAQDIRRILKPSSVISNSCATNVEAGKKSQPQDRPGHHVG